ncbi:cysteine--tRNA ligase [Candidatus Kaiserbacteria bacterium RIFCSPHIGHO2_01_FULL_50_13]|uniref:Cysteine--tRNA ligase n=1 Tax=Candidatus Kaiserbacteria bacterium RIFCSPLOWO2_01_FULL_50_24 TaxID=1798507 RepID=A0A1F6EN07_9BACT|nr:MAG: cysteine--tRNA ligase [Candidatus Kaiserbacteria bacterium RIFCSPHIGHO2_01_FULL_50_13]OGG75005.1 MAG: cysteine--tRNA ligase [Candidatus Kaiserbacteria bacterium RIFCSPLOWO2_01_FULL_50_24]OGG81780.1 MAG: cysteine--tRNA ligase [Candidatus Kaiserbacteria bacterium RIFCSPLOWO2_02_FULL_51_13]
MRWFKDFFDSRKVPVVPLRLHNTLGNALQEFTPPRYGPVKMYNCGPTVYDVQHIGNLSMFVFADTLRRTLEYNGLNVQQVINITDFGHLTSDTDEGEDKMSKGLRREGLELTLENMHALAERYTALFLDDLRKLNIPVDTIEFPRASDYIPAQIAMVKTLEEKEYAYRGKGGVYFDTTRFSRYGELGNIDISKQKEGARIATRAEKKNSADFLLWKSDKKLGWESPWGKGFPGWHIECSAMIRSILGEKIDIHTGGPEHIAVHHNNEIAQSEAVTGKRPFARFWLHRAWIQLENAKIAKSEGSVIYLSDIVSRGLDPLVYRYWLLTAHYRTPANFTWEALEAAQNALQHLVRALKTQKTDTHGAPPVAYTKRFHERINDDLDTPGALAVMWEMVKDTTLKVEDVLAGLYDMDRVLGLGLKNADKTFASSMLAEEITLTELPENVRKLVAEREGARAIKNWQKADDLRAQIEAAGYSIKDTDTSPQIFKK